MMKNIAVLSLALIAFAGIGTAQTATPNTTLCAAQSKTQTVVCLTSTTGIANQAGVYVDQEYEVVSIGANATVCTGPCVVSVSRGNRAAGSGPQAHANSAIAWIAYAPSSSSVPGVTGFSLDTNIGSIGPCTRGSTYYPVIYVNRGIKRDCNISGTLAAGQSGVWVDYAPGSGLDYPSPTPPQALATNGALCVCSGIYQATKAGVLALTLAAPTAGVQDGMIITVTSTTANAHTITATSLLDNGGAGVPYTTATFAAHAGAFITLQAYQGLWYVLSSSNVILS